MKHKELLNRIADLAGPQRALSFVTAAEFILTNDCRRLIETGCYRGTPADGNSTLILAMLAREIGGRLDSFELNPEHIERAKKLLSEHGFFEQQECLFHQGDSVTALSELSAGSVHFAYLDSYDHEPTNPGPCQRHELAEIGALLGKMAPKSAILLDDCVPITGGKTLLGAQFLVERGWRCLHADYQLLFTNA